MRLIILALALTTTAHAQWDLQHSGSTADLRGIASVGAGIAWASGSNGTVLRTEDGGYLWQRCTVPPGAEKLDFRGIQAFDANTAIVMSSGKGDLSRLYKTTDGCQTWTLVFTNPDKDGFWDSLAMVLKSQVKTFRWAKKYRASFPHLYILGDPVGNKKSFRIWLVTANALPKKSFSPPARREEAAFAASNTALIFYTDSHFEFVTGGTGGAHLYIPIVIDYSLNYDMRKVPIGNHSESSGAFSLAFRETSLTEHDHRHEVIVGGDYLKPNESAKTAAFSTDAGISWTASTTPPHGYRSAVAYDAATKSWLTVGPNGTDISTDDGRNWRALKPGPTDAPDADSHWNALSLPFVVGPHGRIGKLNPAALKSAK